MVLQGMPTLIKLMKDPSVVVRDTTAWTVGRICELLPEAAINEMYLAPLLQCLIEGLEAEPRVATNVCWVTSQCFTASFLNQTGPRRPTLLHMKTDLVKLWVSHTHPSWSLSFQALSSLAEAAYEATDAAKDMDEPGTYCLSSSFEIIVHKLLETTDR